MYWCLETSLILCFSFLPAPTAGRRWMRCPSVLGALSASQIACPVMIAHHGICRCLRMSENASNGQNERVTNLRLWEVATNSCPNRIQQALTNSANPRYLAYGEVAHEVLDRLGVVRQIKLSIRLVLGRKANLYRENEKKMKETVVLCRNRSES